MGNPGGDANYDGDLMKKVSQDTEALGTELSKMKGYASEKTATPAAFGNIGDLTRVKDTFSETWENLANSLAKGSEHVNHLGQKVEASFAEQDTRDKGSAEDIQQSGEGN